MAGWRGAALQARLYGLVNTEVRRGVARRGAEGASVEGKRSSAVFGFGHGSTGGERGTAKWVLQEAGRRRGRA